jgi:hypothetical protein
MPRTFLEVAYRGTHYSGFQIQDNAPSIQQEVEKALEVVFRRPFTLTGSSRTDSGVHALQNYFHFDYEGLIDKRILYNINAILPPDIVLKDIRSVVPDAHCRYDALSREYRYYIYRTKNPFLVDRAWFFPLYPRPGQGLQPLLPLSRNMRISPLFPSGIPRRRPASAPYWTAAGRRRENAWFTGWLPTVFCGVWCVDWWVQCCRLAGERSVWKNSAPSSGRKTISWRIFQHRAMVFFFFVYPFLIVFSWRVAVRASIRIS